MNRKLLFTICILVILSFSLLLTSCNNAFCIQESDVNSSFGKYNIYEFQSSKFVLKYFAYLNDEELEDIKYEYDSDLIDLKIENIIQNEYGYTKIYFIVTGISVGSGEIRFTYKDYNCIYKYKIKKSPFISVVSDIKYEEIYDVIESLKYSNHKEDLNVDLYDKNNNGIYIKNINDYIYEFKNDYLNYLPFNSYCIAYDPLCKDTKNIKSFGYYYDSINNMFSYSSGPFKDDTVVKMSLNFFIRDININSEGYEEYYEIYNKYYDELMSVKIDDLDIRLFLLNKKNNEKTDDCIIAMFNDGSYNYLIKITYYKSNFSFIKRK